MKTLYRTTILIGLFAGFISAYGQNNTRQEPITILTSGNVAIKADIQGKKQSKVVVITGTRFCYPLIQKWIDDYNKVNPSVQIIIESRGISDPAQFDILIEVYEQEDQIKKSRKYLYVARYAVLPVANSKSAFSRTYADKGVNQDLINQLFFHDIYADKEKEQNIKSPYTIYTRLQKAGAPIVFTKYFGYAQKDIRGKAIAGSDEHLLKAILRDSTGVSYLPLTIIYDHASKKQLDGLTVLPVDFNGNGRVSEDEKFYGDLTNVIQRLEDTNSKDINNIPVEYVHLSVDSHSINPDAIEFLRWVITNGQNDLHNFGYLKPEPGRLEKEKFDLWASKLTEQ